MGFRFQRRIKLGGGAGLNLSKSGVSTSVRSRYGSVGTKGFSVRTGVPGLTYRSGYRKGSDAGLIALAVLALIALLPLLLRVILVILQLVVMAGAWLLRAVIVASQAIRARIAQRDSARPVEQTLPPPAEVVQSPTRELQKPQRPE